MRANGEPSTAACAGLLSLSTATIDRLREPFRVALGSRKRCGTRPGTLLRKGIPVRTEHWEVAGPGWVEADTVAHCGGSMERDFCWSLTVIRAAKVMSGEAQGFVDEVRVQAERLESIGLFDDNAEGSRYR